MSVCAQGPNQAPAHPELAISGQAQVTPRPREILRTPEIGPVSL